MKRDMDLVRTILQTIENSEKPGISEIDLPEYDSDIIDYHIMLLDEAGLIDANYDELDDGKIIVMSINRLTWDGHEFLSAAKDDKIWNEAKAKIKHKGFELTFKLMQTLLESIMKTMLFQN